MTTRPAKNEPYGTTVEQMELVLENATDVVIQYAPDGTVLWASPSLLTEFGWNPDQVVGTKFEMGVPEDHKATDAPFLRVIGEDGREGHALSRMLCPDGTLRWFDVASRLVRGEDGSPQSSVATLRDVTSQIEAEKAVDASERRFRTLAEHACDVVYETDAAGLVQWVSPSIQQSLGWRSADVIGTWARDLVHWDDPARRDPDQVRLSKGTAIGPTDIQFQTAGGKPRWMTVRAVPVRDATGEVVSVIWGLRDGAEAVRAREATETAESDREHLQATLDSLLDPHLLLEAIRDEAGRIVDFVVTGANDAGCEYNRMPRPQLLGTRLSDLLPGDTESELLPLYAEVIETGEPLILDDYAYPQEIVPSGRHYDIRAVRVDDAISYSWRDVTDRHATVEALAASKERYRLLAAHASDIVYQTDPDGVLEWVSPSVAQVLRWRPEELVGTRAIELIAPEDLPVMDGLWATVHGGQTFESAECRFHTANGELKWMSVHAQPIRDDAGEVVAAVVGLRDCQAEVTTRRALTTLSAGNAIITRAEDEDALLSDMCQTAVIQGGYLFSWYGRPVDDPDQSVTKVAISPVEHHFLDAIDASWGEGPLGQGPAGVALRTGATALRTKRSDEPPAASWAENPTSYGFRSSISLPVFVDGAIDGVLSVYAAEVDAFDRQSSAVLEELAGQIGLGLGRLRSADRLAKSLADQVLLTTAIEQAAEAIVVTDPTPVILYANAAAARSSGYSLDEMLGQNPRMFQSGLHSQSYYQAMWDRVAGGQSWHGMFINRSKDGELYEEDTTIAPIHDPDGTVIAYVAVQCDITREHKMEADLTRQQNDRDLAIELMKDIRLATTLEETAERFCRAVTGLDDIDLARVFLPELSGNIVPLGRVGPRIFEWEGGLPLDLHHLDRLLEKARAGPVWFDLADPAGPAALNPAVHKTMADAGYTSTALVPIRWEGRMVGVLVLASRTRESTHWTEARLGVLEELGSFLGTLIGAQVERRSNREEHLARIADIIDRRRFDPVFQPVVDLASDRVCGYEALTRFHSGRRPDLCFADAHAVGLGTEFESAAVAAALKAARTLPPGVWLSVNFSPAAVIDGHAAAVISSADRPIVIEITEHVQIDSYPALRQAIASCGPVRLSVDDAGAGYASLRHILELQPDFVKLDIGLVRDIDSDPARQALAAGLCHFAVQTSTILIAEGVETEAEANAVRTLGVDLAQGFLFGRPPARALKRAQGPDPAFNASTPTGPTRIRSSSGEMFLSPPPPEPVRHSDNDHPAQRADDRTGGEVTRSTAGSMRLARAPCGGGSSGERDDVVGRGDEQDAVSHAGSGEVIGRSTHRGLLPHSAIGGVEPVERAVLADGPYQAGRDDGWSASGSRVPQDVEAAGGRVDPQSDDSAQAGQEDSGPHHRGPTGHIVIAYRAVGCHLAADPPEVAGVEEVGGTRLAGRHHLAAGHQCGRHGQIEVSCVVGGPRAGGEVLEELQSRRQLEDRVAVVVHVPGRRDRAVAHANPQVSGAVDHRRRATHPDRPLTLPGCRIDGKILRSTAGLAHRNQPSSVGGTVSVVAAEAEHHLVGVEGQGGPLQERSWLGAGWVHVLGQLRAARTGIETDQQVSRSPVLKLVGQYEHLRPGLVDDRGSRDPNGRGDIAAGERPRQDRCADVGRPEDRSGGGCKGVHGVVLGRHVDPA